MATIKDIGVGAAFNIVTATIFLLIFAFLRLQPINDRIFFPKWYLKGMRDSPSSAGAAVTKYVNLNVRSYLKFLSWMPAALKMPEEELIEHAGLDSVVYLRIYLTGLKIFVPITILAFAVLVPVNWTNDTLDDLKVVHSDIDNLSISNIPHGSKRFIAHLVMAYVFTFWTCYVLKNEYERVATMRLRFLASEKRRPDQFTVLVRNIPPDPDESVSELVEHFFLVNHPDHYLKHQTVYNANKLADLVEKKKKMRNWLDYYQFLKPLIESPPIKSFIQGFLPGLALKIFLIVLPTILMYMSQFEGLISQSSLERRTASKYFIFLFFNVFLGSIVTGSALEQLDTYLHASANDIPRIIGVAIPMKATFFITYVMVDGWAGVSLEILRIRAFVLYHLKNFFLVKTEKDREEAMDPGSICFYWSEPRIQLYFLLGLVYAAVTPLLLPFILVFFALGYVVYRHQIINVYHQRYESGAQFWPNVHLRIIVALIASQLLLLGLLSTKGLEEATPVLLVLPILTFWFHKYCTHRYKPAFVRNPLQEAMRKDTLEHAREPNFDLKSYLADSYLHPVFKSDDVDKFYVAEDPGAEEVIVATKRQSRRTTPVQSKYDGSDRLSVPDSIPER
ncbi:unnamed protein product [Triticum turgidum subsp. durum]|uniref:Hyperosmolality-gated Ca2+ permeable channel 1.4 n=1 Tax=Triticum turgidum subsp. durum TaxID=4567 RepID=A0A9R0PYF7_TRITD|nr:unnamed protein product [Triticum turgidum subsp. durum]